MTEKQLLDLLHEMTLKEKVDQMLQITGSFYQKDANEVLTGPENKLGLTAEDLRYAGSILGTAGAERLKKIQERYLETQPHKIPMLFMMDIIHGMKTVFPIPLAQGASFNPALSKECAAAAAKEAAVSGLHVTFAPMADLVRDPRWGRVMESTGEDPYLNSLFARAMVETLPARVLRHALRGLRRGGGGAGLQHGRAVRAHAVGILPAGLPGGDRGGRRAGDDLLQHGKRDPRQHQPVADAGHPAG